VKIFVTCVCKRNSTSVYEELKPGLCISKIFALRDVLEQRCHHPLSSISRCFHSSVGLDPSSVESTDAHLVYSVNEQNFDKINHFPEVFCLKQPTFEASQIMFFGRFQQSIGRSHASSVDLPMAIGGWQRCIGDAELALRTHHWQRTYHIDALTHWLDWKAIVLQVISSDLGDVP
jgi:hypothetical protein